MSTIAGTAQAERSAARSRLRTWLHVALVLALVVGIPLAGILPSTITLRWVSTAIVLVAVLLIYAHLETGTMLGMIMDSTRNKASSSKLQVAAWTVLVLSAFSAAAFWNVTHGHSDPLGVAIPPAIWAVLGISVASFIGSPVVNSSKTSKHEVLPGNPAPTSASFSDVFKGEVQGATDSLDFSKIQMLLFTVIILFAYGAALNEILMSTARQGLPIRAFPSVDDGMVALLGISHSGYLVYKAVPRPTTAAAPSAAPTVTPPGGGQ